MHLLRAYAAVLWALGLWAGLGSMLQPPPATVASSSPAAPAPSRRATVPSHQAFSSHYVCPGLAAAAGSLKKPLLVAVGASFTAGFGAGVPANAWPYDLGRILGWRVVSEGVPGAGYVNPGHLDRGPLAHEVALLHLNKLDPSLVILQAGHNDIGEPLPLVTKRVHSLLGTLDREAPRARVVLMTVFTQRRPSGPDPRGPLARATDTAIVTAARHADPDATIVDPLAGHWRFSTLRDHLHPTPAGHLDIARRVAQRLCAPVASRHLHRSVAVRHLVHRS